MDLPPELVAEVLLYLDNYEVEICYIASSFFRVLSSSRVKMIQGNTSIPLSKIPLETRIEVMSHVNLSVDPGGNAICTNCLKYIFIGGVVNSWTRCDCCHLIICDLCREELKVSFVRWWGGDGGQVCNWCIVSKRMVMCPNCHYFYKTLIFGRVTMWWAIDNGETKRYCTSCNLLLCIDCYRMAGTHCHECMVYDSSDD